MDRFRPHLYSSYRFHYGGEGHSYTSFFGEKSQYVYRFLVLAEGELSAVLGGRSHPLRIGDLLYLPPGERYRLAAAAPFSVFQISFDLFGERAGERPLFCVPAGLLREEWLSPLPEGAEAAPLRTGGVVRGTSALRLFTALSERDRAAPLWQFYADTALASTLTELLGSAVPDTGRDSEILAYINAHPEADLTPAALAARFSYHPNYINSLVKRWTGLSLSSYVRRTRMTYARDLLTHGGLTPSEVATALGYYDYSHFYKAFRAEHGVNPTEYLGKRG